MRQFRSLILFSEKPKALADFYGKVFESTPGWTGGEFVGFKVGDGYITVGPHSKVKGMSQEPERIMLMIEVDMLKAEFERVKKLGAKVIAEPYQPGEADGEWLCTFADPDGNYFQISEMMKM
jgi:predicted enzyme related to lactoylglutathione lyase